MSTQDEELQNQIESGQVAERSTDAEAYRQVFSVLRQEVPFSVSASFADQVVERVMREAEHKEASRDRLWFMLGSALFLIGFVVSLVLVDFKPTVGVFTFFAGYPGLLIFGALFIGLLHFLDKKFIRTSTPQ
jgi:hypothetical protein